MKTSYYIPGLNFTKDAPMDFLLMVAHNTVQYKLDGYVFYVDHVPYLNIEYIELIEGNQNV